MLNTKIEMDQENNQLLLNAIKNKFADIAETSSFSPPKFNIPALKIAANSNASPSSSTESNDLNLFLLKQLQAKQSKCDDEVVREGSPKGFMLPQLQFGKENLNTGTQFDIPLLKTSSNNKNISGLTAAINELQVDPSPSITGTIDLTTALASKSSSHQGTPPTRAGFTKQKQFSSTGADFDIPFIDCDRQESKIVLALNNEYCQIDISHLTLQPTCVQQPSVVGQFLSLVDKRYTPAKHKCLISSSTYKGKVKHNVQPFSFETNSPDDIVLASLNKFRR